MSIAISSDKDSKKVTTLRLQEMKQNGIKISCLTAYDALIARIMDESGVDLILVGDSLGNVVQGLDTTLPVTLEQIIYHTKTVMRGARRALVVADMPFMTYQVSPQEALRNAGRIMKETGCAAVKLEGGKNVAEAVKIMSEAGIPVMGHLGLTPQSIHKFGSYRARGVESKEADDIFNDALILQEAGAFSIVLEKVPLELGKKISEALKIPTIGIGAGPYCDGQVLVYSDMLGMTLDFNPRFVRRYANLYETAKTAFANFSNDVKKMNFPGKEESY
jgi:3-methyl-2-oxobutanoate hydroxymethyltransferase